MEDNRTLKDILADLVKNLELDDESLIPMRDFLTQAIFPAVAAKVVLNGLHETFDELNEQNREMLGFDMREEDFLNAIMVLIPARIKELREEREEFENTPYVDTGDVS